VPGETRRAAVAAFIPLLVLAVVGLYLSRDLMSNSCVDGGGQTVCPVSGPDWARPVPAYLALASLAAGLAAIALGRAARRPALIVAFALGVIALVLGLLLR
jgi:hypothetical protein